MVSAGENLKESMSSTLSVLRAMEEKLKCAVCKQLLQEPTLMTCNHIFCRECIPKYMVSVCPVCEARFLSKNLRPAPYIEYMLKIHQKIERLLQVLSKTDSSEGSFMGKSQLTPFPQSVKRDGGSQMNTSCQQDCIQIGKATASTNEDREFVSVTVGFEKRDGGSQINTTCEQESTKIGKATASTNGDGEFVPISAGFEKTANASSGVKKRTERKEVAGSSVKRVKLTSQVPIGIYVDECIFCHSFRRKMKGLGKLLYIQDGKVVLEPDISSKARVVYAHEFCLYWSPGIYYEGDQIMNLQNEIRRSAKLTCAKCGIKGASLGCYYKTCPRSYHPPCANQILECHWDTENYCMLCPYHVSKKLRCDSGPAHSDKATNKNNLRPQSTQKVKNVYCRRNKQNKLTQTEAREQSKGKMLVLLAVQLSEADMGVLVHFSERFSAILTDKWRNDVTHVVTSSDTIQKCIQLRHAYEVMMAILQGTWIINIGWIKACLEKEGVPEEHYEVHKDCYGYLEGPRRGRLRAVANKAPNLFTRYGFVLSKDFPQDTKCRLTELLTAGGGEVLEEESESDPVSNMGLLATFLVYNGESQPELGLSGRMEQLVKVAKKKHCGRIVSHKMVEDAIVNFDTNLFN